jgi:type II secretory pathway pseudopilin PulG
MILVPKRNKTCPSMKKSSEVVGAASAPAAFTLIEVIGILAVLAILATVIISTTTGRLDIAAASLESRNLVSYATALQNNILRNRYIPGASDWPTVIAAELGVNVSSVTNTARNNPRYFLIDPELWIRPNDRGVLPYAQSDLVLAIAASGQTNQPFSPRVMIVSSLSTPLPSFITSGTASSSAVFSNVWNWPDRSAAPPAGWPANWNNRGTDLVVQRINLAPLFVHLTLQNYPPPPLYTSQGQYAIAGLGPYQVPNSPNNGVNAYFLKSTVLSLFQDGAGGALQADQILGKDASFFYIQGVWRGTIDFGTNINQSVSQAAAMGSVFVATAQAFVASPYNINGGTTPPMVVSNMSSFMAAYIAYANAGFPLVGYLPGNARSWQSAMQTAMGSLVNNLTPGGCTPPPTP